MKYQKLRVKVCKVVLTLALVPLFFMIIPAGASVNAATRTDHTQVQNRTLKEPTTESTSATTEALNTDINNVTVNLDSSGKLSTSFDSQKGNQNTFWNWIYARGKYFITGITGVGTIVCLGFFVILGLKLAYAGVDSSAQVRKTALTGMIWTGIGTAVLGATTIIFVLFFGFFK